jgi:hypothetical protein
LGVAMGGFGPGRFPHVCHCLNRDVDRTDTTARRGDSLKVRLKERLEPF